MFYFINTPWWLKKIYPHCIWHIPVQDKTIFLTFDDGPHAEATPFVLEQLKRFNFKATFFCIGKNVIEHPDIFQRIKNEGHSVGNHTMNHANGWKTNNDKYLKEITEANTVIHSNLFRPPYGRIKKSQIKEIQNMNFIMWSVLSGDFDTQIDGMACFKNTTRNIKPGCIIVFHDSAKASPRLKVALPMMLKWMQENGYSSTGISL